MLKVALIDDEAMVLKGMTMVLKKEENIQLAGTAADGEEGLEMIYREKPDIVLTDICMPGLSGLEMIEQAQKAFPDIVYIVFSGFNEFKYVQKAMGMGVLDYLEKPVTVTDLKRALNRAQKMVEYKRSYVEMKNRENEVNKVFVEQLFYKLLHRPQDMEEATLKELAELDETLAYITELVVCCVGEVHHKPDSEEAYRQLLQQLTFSMLKEERIRFFTVAEEQNIYFVYLNESCMSFPFYEKISEIKEEMAEAGIEFAAGLSNIHGSIYEVRTALMEAKNALTYAAFMDEELVVTNEAVQYQHCSPIGILDSHRSVELNFRLGNYSETREQIEAHLSLLKGNILPPEILRQECMEMINLMRNLYREKRKDRELYLEKGLFDELWNLTSASKILDWTRIKITDIISRAENEEQELAEEKNNTVERLKTYINEHYAEGITLEILADLVHMNAAYVSILFKREEGISYSNYLTDIRMEHAGKLLEKGEKAKDVCEKVGYFDYRYFNRVFKKYYHMTPDTYKKSRI